MRKGEGSSTDLWEALALIDDWPLRATYILEDSLFKKPYAILYQIDWKYRGSGYGITHGVQKMCAKYAWQSREDGQWISDIEDCIAWLTTTGFFRIKIKINWIKNIWFLGVFMIGEYLVEL